RVDADLGSSRAVGARGGRGVLPVLGVGAAAPRTPSGMPGRSLRRGALDVPAGTRGARRPGAGPARLRALLAVRAAAGDREVREVGAEPVVPSDQVFQRKGLLQRRRTLDPAVRAHQVHVLVLAGAVVLGPALEVGVGEDAG